MKIIVTGLVMACLGAGATAHAEGRFGVGLRTTSQHVAGSEDDGNDIHMVGGGLMARWRFAHAWSVELSLEALSGEIGGGYQRKSGLVSVAALWHLTPDRPWDLYFLLGLGGVHDQVVYTAASRDEVAEEHGQTMATLGAGLEYRWTHLAVGVELRAVGMTREDEEDARPEDAVPPRSRGGQGSLTASYYF